MSEYDSILSRDELLEIYRSLDNPKHDRDSVIDAMGAAVDAAMRKLAKPFTPKTPAEMRDFIGMNFDSLQYSKPETEEPDEMDRYTLTIHDLLSAFSWAGHYDCDHIPAASKMVVPDGWHLVPVEPTENQIISAMEASLLGRPSVDDEAYVMGIIEAYLSAAPKYTEGKK